jgi:hypothetical protein
MNLQEFFPNIYNEPEVIALGTDLLKQSVKLTGINGKHYFRVSSKQKRIIAKSREFTSLNARDAEYAAFIEQVGK